MIEYNTTKTIPVNVSAKQMPMNHFGVDAKLNHLGGNTVGDRRAAHIAVELSVEGNAGVETGRNLFGQRQTNALNNPVSHLTGAGGGDINPAFYGGLRALDENWMMIDEGNGLRNLFEFTVQGL